ncbi:MAG TPA: glycosyltransferase family 4 protein [Edaphocola sp.]|nr:glycosyltransferase family 4 protein [Edaphocola sp.]
MSSEKSIIIVAEIYLPTAAAINRLLAFAKAYGELNIKVKVVFISPNSNFDKVPLIYKNVQFVYLWDKLKFRNRYLKYILLRINIILFMFRLKRDDILIVNNLFNFLWLFRLKRGIQLYYEVTEHPDLINKDNNSFNKLLHRRSLTAAKKLDGLFVISPSLKEYFVNEIRIKEHRVLVVNMIVDATRFDIYKDTRKQNSIMYCGTISESKDGIDYLMQSFALVLKRYPDFKLTILGSFENEQIKQRFYKLMNELDIKENVDLKGPVAPLDLPRYLCSAKILVLARPKNKQAQFGFPTKLGEYLMTANPVVVTKVGDLQEYLSDKKEVIFAEPNNIDDFAEKIIWTLDNYELASEIGELGREKALKEFNNIIEAQKVIDIIFK